MSGVMIGGLVWFTISIPVGILVGSLLRQRQDWLMAEEPIREGYLAPSARIESVPGVAFAIDKTPRESPFGRL